MELHTMIKLFFNYYVPAALKLLKRFVLAVYWNYLRKTRSYHVTKTRQGAFKISTKDSVIGRLLVVEGQFEYDFSIKAIDFLKANKFLKDDNVLLYDIGANIGIIGVGLLRAKKVKCAIAVEPEPSNFKLLSENVKLNNLQESLLCLNYALGEQDGVLKMELSDDNPGDHRVKGANELISDERYGESKRRMVDVRAMQLDKLIKEPEVASRAKQGREALVWIDVQGYEGYVFKGARTLLSSGIPVVSEIWPYGILRAGMKLDEFTNIISSNWTDFWVLRGDRFIRYPVSVFDRYLDELGTEDGYGNVIFTKGSLNE
jgi:FkbM family methyltransferase